MTESVDETPIDRLLERALDLAPAERERFLRQTGASNPRLRERLSRLLALTEQNGGMLDRSPLRVDEPSGFDEPLAPNLGTCVGPFRLVRLLGVGGMGEVYLAERVEGGFRQRVALKLARAGVAAKPERFEAERQILAELDHPGIARLHDGGVAADGRPYMAMEYVEGQDLLAYCETHEASLEERLNLFLQVCDAVSYAHAHLVVHRDLKPANIFVTADAQVKLLDFGIAKLLHPDLAAADTRTAHLSPAYAAPEQLTGGAITTATDVYGLGVSLFQLLSGRLPWQVSELPLALAVQRLLDELPPRPSTVAAASAPVPARRLRGDLDAIVAKALRKEPASRYPDARALADDLRRHLRHAPVQARAGARAYVLRRFLRRNWLPLATAAVTFAALAVGIAIALWQAQRAQHEAARATATKDFLLAMFKASDPRVAADKPHAEITARELLDRGAARIEKDFSGQPELQIELLGLTADIYERLPDEKRYAALQKRRIELARSHYGAAHPIVIEGLIGETEALVFRHGYAEAQGLLDQVDRLLRSLDEDRGLLRAKWWMAQASLLYSSAAPVGDISQALEQALALYQQLAPTGSDYAAALDMASSIALARGDLVTQLRYQERAMTALEATPDRDDAVLAQHLHDYARNLEGLGRFESAESAFLRAETLARQTVGERHSTYWLTLGYHARMLHRRGQRERALRMLQRMMELIPPDWTTSTEDAWARGLYAVRLAAEGRPHLAIPLLEETLRRFLEKDYRGLVPVWRIYLGDAYDLAGRTGEARSMFEAAIAALLASPPETTRAPVYHERWGRFLLDHAGAPGSADFNLAEAEFHASLASAGGKPTAETALAHAGLARIAAARGELAGAFEESRLAFATLAATEDLYDLRAQPQLWLVHSALLLQSGDAAGARLWAGKALEASRRYDDPAAGSISRAEAAMGVAVSASGQK
ncbi:MAG: protein kinase domain-containing protein [Panacagrimonas sp.]